MFHHLNEKILMRCLDDGLAVPRELLSLRYEMKQFIDIKSREWKLGELLIKGLGIVKEMNRGGLGRCEAVERLKELDRDMFDVVKGTSSDSGYDLMLIRKLKVLFKQT